ncbi:HlyD family secretion protein [Cellvibrio polysaccharolyticus]|uniref:HlyD family efflux transporter periplasmic adaptor subunit n=1 Tax=Cellvibrio polysaccharolyticus TaxID=2082724 RepID=A0A928V0Z9_9GAMM|nr:HlyD family efflux transporter periplasmic adaptor subunit [Cellvibrio polysaccharolyticus]MBE8716317.1 HlyD family efflux transporter periplasmic adaptor subunit [Cellvibrio polysaccharolyticus]
MNSECSSFKKASLFREQVIEQKADRLHGDVLLLPHLRHSVLIFSLLVWLLAVAIWLATSTYARKETVVGWLEPPTGVVRLYPESSGQVKKVLVKEGDRVQVGQPLMIINGDRTLADGGNLEGRLLEEFESQRRLLKEQITRAGQTHQHREGSLVRQVESLQHNLALMDEQMATLDARHTLIKNQLERYRPLVEEGHISHREYDSFLSQELSVRSERQALLREIGNQRDLLSQRLTDLQLLPQDAANSLDQLQSRLSELAQQIAQLNGERAHVITATRAGIINNLQAREGQFVSSVNPVPLLTLADSASPLVAHLLVPVRAAGFIAPGQRLDIRYDAFSYQKFGLYQGEIAQVAKTPLLPGELLNASFTLQEPVYLVEARLYEQGVHAYGQEISLKSGMTLTADVELSERRLWQWLLEPIYSLRGRL